MSFTKKKAEGGGKESREQDEERGHKEEGRQAGRKFRSQVMNAWCSEQQASLL